MTLDAAPITEAKQRKASVRRTEVGDSLISPKSAANSKSTKLSPNSGMGATAETGDRLRTQGDGESPGSEKLSPLSASKSLKAYRVTSPADVERMEAIAREAHAESRYGHIPFSREKFLRANKRILTGGEDALALYLTYGDEGAEPHPNDTPLILSASKDGAAAHHPQIVGLLGAEVDEYFLGTGTRIATCHVLYVSAAIRPTLLGGRVGTKLIRLFADFEVSFGQSCRWHDWSREGHEAYGRMAKAKSRGAAELNIHVTSGIDPERTDKLLTRLGFAPYGGNYSGRVE